MSWCYRIRAVNDATSAVYVDYFDSQPPRLIFESLADLIASYDHDAKSIHKW